MRRFNWENQGVESFARSSRAAPFSMNFNLKGMFYKMNCPNCKGLTEIVEEKELKVGLNRTRRCLSCGFRFDTYIRADGEFIKTQSCREHICPVCGKRFYGKANKKSCSVECRSKLFHKKRNLKDYDKVHKTKKPKNSINDFIKAQAKAEQLGKYLSYAEWAKTH